MKPITFVIGRFQVPSLHAGHMHLIQSAVDAGYHTVVLLGSANRPASIKNPWSYDERAKMIKSLFPSVTIYPLNDYKYSDPQWMADVAATVDHEMRKWQGRHPVLVGSFKQGNDYLKWFPQYPSINIEPIHDIDGTRVREAMFGSLPKSVQDDVLYFKAEKENFKDYPYPDSLNINCADPLVECIGHILLVERGRAPGEGTWALPGGHKLTMETFLDCAVRELYEETNLRVPEKVLRGSLVNTRLFDAFNRGNGIPRTTMACHFVINPNPDGSLPRANGQDDARQTRWVPLNDVLNKYKLYDDHGDIISVMTKVSPVIAWANKQIYV